MHSSTLLAALAALVLSPLASADGLYSKNSAVLQLNEKSFDKLIKKSTQASIVEFYAPWCGHCKSLKPAYEKAAESLKDIGQVAAVNCDDDANKAFCGTMGIKGFPTLKTVRPTLTIGKPIIQDYNGPRTAAGIVEAVKGLIANHVKRITDKDLDGWLAEKNETAKAILFSDKGTTSALIRVLAVDYYGNLEIAQIRDKDTAAVATFGITKYPTLLVLPGGTAPAVVYDGELAKKPMSAFLNQYAEMRPTTPPKASKKETKAKSSSTKSSTSTVADDPASETPTAEEETPKASAEPLPPPALHVLLTPQELRGQCLGPKTSTCILALLPPASEDKALPPAAIAALASLSELSAKHRARKADLFPFFAVPSENAGAGPVREALGLGREMTVLVAVNGRRGWWRRLGAQNGFGLHEIEGWVDEIRLGDGKKEKLPEALLGGDTGKVEEVKEAVEEVVEDVVEKVEEVVEDVKAKVVHEDL